MDHGTSSSLQQGTAISDIAADNMISGNHHQQQLAPTYSNPIGTSIGYHKGFLKSDHNISSNHPSIRVAFRYIKEKNKLNYDKSELIGKSEEVEDGASSTNDMDDADKPDDMKKQKDKDETLYLCWINQDGIPCHFRPLHPTIINCNNITTTTNDINGHGNLRGNQSTTSDTSHNQETDTTTTTNLLLVNEHDHIETTFPSHAFIFCRRVDNDTLRHTTDTSTNENDDGSDDSNEDDMLVVQENDRTYFIRKCNTTQDEENDTIQRETYLAVGGFRPDPMPERREDDQEEEGKIEEGGEESELESDDDSFDGGRELVQLVTIRSIQRKSVEKESPRLAIEADSDEDIDLPSSALGCSDCTQSVPFLRGAMNPRPPHTNAFVATDSTSNSSNNIENGAPSSLHQEIPTHNHDEDTEHTLQVTVCLTRLDPTPIDTSTKHYDKVILGGWPCRIEPGCFPSDMDIPANGKNLLRTRFESDLEAASKSLPFEAREKLKSSTPIWINKSQSFGPKVAPVKGRAGCFHPGSKWLKRNGMNPAKCGGVEWYDAKHYLTDCDLWGTGGLMLHELSHAWHCLHIEDGYDNEDIINVYKAAMDEGLYDCVRVHGKQGPKCKAYACQDQMEYFAELSVAFLGTEIDEDREHNKWYPFNRRQLREHDPRAYAMLCRMWGVTADTDSGIQEVSSDRNDE